jgi:hypothetical protein
MMHGWKIVTGCCERWQDKKTCDIIDPLELELELELELDENHQFAPFEMMSACIRTFKASKETSP